MTGSEWVQQPYTMKLEGARGGPFQTIMIIGIEDPAVLARLDEFPRRDARASAAENPEDVRRGGR